MADAEKVHYSFILRIEIHVPAVSAFRVNQVLIIKDLLQLACSRDADAMVRVSAFQWVERRFIPLVKSYQKTLKMVSTAFMLGAWHLKGGCGEQAGKIARCALWLGA